MRRRLRQCRDNIGFAPNAMTTATAPIRAHVWNNRLQQSLAAWYVFIWILTAIAPVDRRDWVLENFVVVLFIALLIGLVVPVAMTPILVILAVLGAVTALQRGWSALVRA